MSDFETFRAAVVAEAEEIAKSVLKRGVKEAREDAEAFVLQSAEKIERWTRLLAAGDITREEFATLMGSQKDLAELHALTRTGIAASRLKRFREKLTEAATTTALHLLL